MFIHDFTSRGKRYASICKDSSNSLAVENGRNRLDSCFEAALGCHVTSDAFDFHTMIMLLGQYFCSFLRSRFVQIQQSYIHAISSCDFCYPVTDAEVRCTCNNTHRSCQSGQICGRGKLASLSLMNSTTGRRAEGGGGGGTQSLSMQPNLRTRGAQTTRITEK